MSESNWTNRMMAKLDDGFSATVACMLDDRFAAQEQAARDLETRVAALENAVARVASGCKWPDCENIGHVAIGSDWLAGDTPLSSEPKSAEQYAAEVRDATSTAAQMLSGLAHVPVAPEPFTCGPGHAALREDDESARVDVSQPLAVLRQMQRDRGVDDTVIALDMSQPLATARRVGRERNDDAPKREGATITAGPDTKHVRVTGEYEVVEEDGDAPKRGWVTREEWEWLRNVRPGPTSRDLKRTRDAWAAAFPGVDRFRLRLRSNGNLEYECSPVGVGSALMSAGYKSMPPAKLIDTLIADGICQMPEIVEPDTPPTCEPGACELAMVTRQRDALRAERDDLYRAAEELRTQRDRAYRERDAAAEERDDLAADALGGVTIDDLRDVLGVDCDEGTDPLDAIVELREERTRLREERDELRATVERVREYVTVVQDNLLKLPFGMRAAAAAVLALLGADTPTQEG